MNKRLNLPPIMRTIDGRSYVVHVESIGSDKGRKRPPRSVRRGGLTALPVAGVELESNSNQALDRRLDQALEENVSRQ